MRRHGFARLTSVPAVSGAVCEVVTLFGHVRETNYGRWFDVRAEVDAACAGGPRSIPVTAGVSA